MATKYMNLNEFISLSEKTPISYNNTSFIEPFGNVNFTIHNVIMDYIEELRELSYSVSFTEKEYRKYKYKPKLLANDIYGNGEYYFIILAINNLADVKYFDQKTVLLLKREDMVDCISKIYNTEKNNIDIYNKKVSS